MNHRRFLPFLLFWLSVAAAFLAPPAAAQLSLPRTPTPYVSPPAPPTVPGPEAQRSRGSLSPAPKCDTCYHGFRFDSSFVIGAHFNGVWPGAMMTMKNELHVTQIQYYNGPTLPSRLLNKLNWHDTVPPGGELWRKRLRWIDSIGGIFYGQMDSAGMKFIYTPGKLWGLRVAAEAAELYFAKPPQVFDGTGDTVDHKDFATLATPDFSDRPKNSFLWGGKFFRDTAAGDLLMAGGSRWTFFGLNNDADGDRNFDTSTGHPEVSGKYDLTLGIRATPNTEFNDLPPTTLLAYARVYRRVRLGQDSGCGCNLYEQIAVDSIRKSRYQADSTVRDSHGYREIVFTHIFPDSLFTPATDLVVEKSPGHTVAALKAGVPVSRWYPRQNNGWAGWGAAPNEADTSGCGRFCKRLGDSLGVAGRGYIASGKLVNRGETVEGADIYYDVVTTRKAEISFLFGRIAPRRTTLLHATSAYDTLIRRTVDTIIGIDTLGKRLMARVGVTDEAYYPKYRPTADIAPRVARAILANDSNDTRGMWTNPISQASNFRVVSGDLDTADVRVIHMFACQQYNFGGRVPLFYANPDSMAGSPALHGFWRAAGSTRMIAYNTSGDYTAFTSQSQEAIAGRLGALYEATDAARFRFRHIRSESYPVYSVIHTQGWPLLRFDGGGNAIGYDNAWGTFRITTPEEITVQAFIALNSGVDGLYFGDFTYDNANEFGLVHWMTGPHDTTAWGQRWDFHHNYVKDLNPLDIATVNDTNWNLPLMWVGFEDRYNAAKRITAELYDKLLPTYMKLDRTNAIRMSAHVDSYAAMPLIDTIIAQQAHPDSLGGHYRPKMADGAPVKDTKSETLIEATVFTPGPLDTNRTSRVLLLTNRRLWPVDSLTYGDTAQSRGAVTKGFGAIDVRRPVIRLKNDNGLLADSVRIERIGYAGTARTVPYRDTVQLDWLEPGWGAMYRITPLPKHVSALATAYNNAVHALNPSVDGAVRDRIVVYERDSAVYLRALDSNGVWGPENIISRPNDTVSVAVGDGTYRNKADNMSPSIDMLRSSGTSCLIVWERHDRATDSVTVESVWLPFKPRRDSFPASGTIVRTRLSAPRPFAQSWMKLTPAVTGVDSGYVVAWAAPDYTVELKAMRNTPSGLRTDTSRVLRVKMPAPSPTQPLDSACGYPTLAYRRNWNDSVALNDGIASALTDTTDQRAMPPHAPGVPDTTTALHILHLAYQQGARSNSGWHIMYNTLGVKFPGGGAIPELWAAPTEEASYNMRGCEFVYPSIGVDSARVGVTFTRKGSYGSIALRFRNDAQNIARALRWSVPTYHWGGADFRARGAGPFPLIGFRNYERSSVTLFPARDSTDLRTSFEGGLTWHWINTPNNAAGVRQHGVKFYRFGNIGTDSLNDGQHPTMMLVPCVGDNANHAMQSSGVLRRGPSIEAIDVARRATSYRYYTALLDNTPAAPLDVFTASQQTDSVHSSFDIRSESAVLAGYTCPPSANGGVRGGFIIRPTSTHGGIPDPPGSVTPTPGGLPPSFFPNTPTGNGVVLSLSDAMAITRTGDFPADTVPVLLTRVLEGNDSLVEWLNSQPDDTLTHEPANVFMAMRIVRASDDSVLWSGDTVSARGIGADTLIDELSVPVDSVATPGTDVYVQLAVATTAGLGYVVGGEFHFLHGDVSSASPKTVRRETSPTPRETSESEIGVEMIPNPVRTDAGELHVRLGDAGKARIAVYDLVGNRVLALPDLVAKRVGTYTVPVDLSALRAGLYVVEVRMNGKRGMTQVSVVR